MKKLLYIVLCTSLLWIGAACSTAEAQDTGLVLTTKSLTVSKHSAPRLTHKQYRGSHYSPVKFQPRRYTWQRNLGQLEGYMPAPKAERTTYRIRTRPVVSGATTRHRAATRTGVVRRRASRSARNRTQWGGFGTHN